MHPWHPWVNMRLVVSRVPDDVGSHLRGLHRTSLLSFFIHMNLYGAYVSHTHLTPL
jgi:hypothetical protein